MRLRDGAAELTAESVREFAAASSRTTRSRGTWRVVDDFPMTVTGKVRKVEMREKSVALLHLEDAAAIRNA